MARIAGVDLPREKRVEVGLTYIYGIGLTTSQKMIAEIGINPDTRIKDLSETEISKLRDYIEHHLKVEGDLRREVSLNVKRLMEIGCYRGVRHRRGLPVRGQNTKQNARTPCVRAIPHSGCPLPLSPRPLQEAAPPGKRCRR